MWHLPRIKSIILILTKDSCETLIVVPVLSQLDYANCLFIGLPECDLQKLQRVQNIAAKIVLKSEDNLITSQKTALVANIFIILCLVASQELHPIWFVRGPF